MSLQLRDAEPRSIVHPPQAILIGGENVGEVEWIDNIGQGRWHAVIRVPGGNASRWSLFQGFGDTPEQAVMDAVATGRRERDAYAERLAWLESELGTAETPTEKLKHSFAVEAGEEVANATR